jgi:hypothetical protein
MAKDAKMDFETTGPISRAHAGALAARMMILEEDCREIERNLDGFHGILYEYAGEIPEASKQRMRGMLAEILGMVTSIRQELGLPKQVVELDKLIESRLSRIWVTLHESKSRGLRGYGVVPEDLKKYLDPRMDGMLSLLTRLQQALRERRAEGKREGASNEAL